MWGISKSPVQKHLLISSSPCIDMPRLINASYRSYIIYMHICICSSNERKRGHEFKRVKIGVHGRVGGIKGKGRNDVIRL